MQVNRKNYKGNCVITMSSTPFVDTNEYPTLEATKNLSHMVGGEGHRRHSLALVGRERTQSAPVGELRDQLGTC